MTQLTNLPAAPTVGDIFSAFPDLYLPFADFCQRLFRGPGPLSHAERELIFAYASDLNRCAYCHGGHAATAEALGIAAGTFEALRRGIDAAPVAAKMKPLLRYVQILTEAPARIAPADAEAVYEAGWDAAALHQAIAVCALANFMNRLVEGAGVHAKPADFAARAKMAVERGYQQPFLDRLAALSGAKA
ncbi:MAG: carboxymuconolactone decarboxylase family protein [Rhodospirillaceae bacterium]|nr:carboxymuconolactone decarboxylase family protein [Rhodospirillaceae bacterium]